MTMFSFKKDKDKQQAKSDSRSESASTGWLTRLRSGLAKTRENLTENLTSLLAGQKNINDDLLEEIETQLLVADIGVDATREIIAKLTERLNRKELNNPESVISALKQCLHDILNQSSKPLQTEAKNPFILLVVGVNGAGKTTTIGKMANHFRKQGKKVMLAAGDTANLGRTQSNTGRCTTNRRRFSFRYI